jgi:hypothetical protein
LSKLFLNYNLLGKIKLALDYARKFYSGAKWRRCRNGFMRSQFFICSRCGGRATVAHHVVPVTPGNLSDPGVTLNWGNLVALCSPCHNAVHGGSGAVQEGLYFDGEGELKDLKE